MTHAIKTYIVALVGASASGKTTIANAQAEAYDDSYRWKQMTTRNARSTDEEYVFVDKDTIKILRERNLLTCCTEFNGNTYGTFIETLAPKFVYVVVSPEGLMDLINTKDNIEIHLSKEIVILPINVTYNVSEESINLRGRDRSYDFVVNEIKVIDDLDVDWFLTVDSDNTCVHTPEIFRELLIDKLKTVEFNRDDAINKLSTLTDDVLARILESIDSDEETDKWDNRELGSTEEFAELASKADDDELQSILAEDDNDSDTNEYSFLDDIEAVDVSDTEIENITDELITETIDEMRERVKLEEEQRDKEERTDKAIKQTIDTQQSNANRPYNFNTVKATFKDDFLDFVTTNDVKLMSLVDEVSMESQVASFLRSVNMPKDEVESAETIKVKTDRDTGDLTTVVEIFIHDKFLSRIVFNEGTNTIS